MDDFGTRSRASLYDRDFYAWTREQAALIRQGNMSAVDLPNLLEEIETLGRSEASALESTFRLICMHQLKPMMQSERSDSIRERNHAARLLRDNPCLKNRQAQLFDSAYADARREASGETGVPLSTFPQQPPFSFQDMLHHDYWAPAAQDTSTRP